MSKGIFDILGLNEPVVSNPEHIKPLDGSMSDVDGFIRAVNRDELDVIMEEITAETGELETAFEAHNTLTDIYNLVKESNEGGGLTVVESKLVSTTLRHFVGENYDRRLSLTSESFQELRTRSQASRLLMEGIGDVIKTAIKAVADFIRKIIEGVKNLFKKIFGNTGGGGGGGGNGVIHKKIENIRKLGKELLNVKSEGELEEVMKEIDGFVLDKKGKQNEMVFKIGLFLIKEKDTLRVFDAQIQYITDLMTAVIGEIDRVYEDKDSIITTANEIRERPELEDAFSLTGAIYIKSLGDSKIHESDSFPAEIKSVFKRIIHNDRENKPGFYFGIPGLTPFSFLTLDAGKTITSNYTIPDEESMMAVAELDTSTAYGTRNFHDVAKDLDEFGRSMERLITDLPSIEKKATDGTISDNAMRKAFETWDDTKRSITDKAVKISIDKYLDPVVNMRNAGVVIKHCAYVPLCLIRVLAIVECAAKEISEKITSARSWNGDTTDLSGGVAAKVKDDNIGTIVV